MSRFKSIRNKIIKKSSVSINEKIAALNQELEKTGMLSEVMRTDNVLSTSTYVPEVPQVTSEVPDPNPDNGITSDDWQQPLGNDADGNAASAAPTSFPKIWTNAGYLDPTDGLLNKSDLNGDGANHPIYNLPDWQDASQVPDGGVGGVQIEVGGMDPGIVGGYLSADGFTRTTGDNVRLGSPTFKTHPDQFKPVNYWVPFSIFNPFIDSYWPNNSLGRTPQYQGIVKGTEDGSGGAPMALFTAYVYTGGGRATYVSQEGRPPTTKDPIRRGLEDEPIYPGPIESLFGLGKRGFDWLKEKAKETLDNIKDTFGYRAEITGSMVADEEFIKTSDEVSEREKDDLRNDLDGIEDDIPINNEETGYSDERFYEDKNGNIVKKKKDPKNELDVDDPNFKEKINDPEWRERLKEWEKENEEHPDNTGFVSKKQKESSEEIKSGEVGGIAGRGKAHHEFVNPTDNVEDAYYHLKDYAYANVESNDEAELPSSLDKTVLNTLSGALAGMKTTEIGGNPGPNPNIQDKYGESIRGMSVLEVKIPYSEWSDGMKKSFHKRTNTKPPSTNESYITEGVRLGLYEPEAMNVDLSDIRKGVMPEYPKKPPAEMIDGYHEKSRIRPKPLENEPYVKISKADLIRNHRLKPSEADEMMDTINMINDHIKNNPEDLIHAQMRYPKDDPRLAELNWKMDQMLEAGEEYLDSNFKENQTLYKRATDRTKKNIKLTDPEYVQKHYDELRGTPKPKKTKLVGRLGKHLNKYESKSLFKHVNSKNFKKISERKLEKEKSLGKQEQERLDYINDINGEMDEFRSDWRKDISESDFTNITMGNKVGQTFQHTSGATITLDNTMSDTSEIPTQVTLDLGFGEKITVDAPGENEYAIAGVTKPLDKKVMQKQSVKTAKEINDQLDASEKSSESKSARVPIETGDLGYKSTDEILADKGHQYTTAGDQWTYDEYMNQMSALSDRYAKIAEPLEKVKLDYIYNKHEAVPIGIVDAIDAITHALFAAQEALHQAWIQYNKVPDLPPVSGEGEEELSTEDDEKFLKKQQTLVNLTKGLNQIGLPNDFAQWTINYAKGDMTPITKFSPGMERQVRNLVLDKFKKNPNATTVSIQYDDYGFAAKALPTRLGLGRFTATKLDNGKIRIQDTFNVDKDLTNIGFADIIPGLQDTADRLVDISYKNRNLKGRTDEGGITVDVLIDSGFVKKKRGSAFNKIKKIRNK